MNMNILLAKVKGEYNVIIHKCDQTGALEYYSLNNTIKHI